MDNQKEIAGAMAFMARTTLELHKHPLMEALLAHYAAFVEAQTGVPAADTIKQISDVARAKDAEYRTYLETSLLKAIKDADSI